MIRERPWLIIALETVVRHREEEKTKERDYTAREVNSSSRQAKVGTWNYAVIAFFWRYWRIGLAFIFVSGLVYSGRNTPFATDGRTDK